MDEGHSNNSLCGAHALVTGGGTGIGRGIATALAREGAVVTLAARRREVLEQGATQIRADVPGCDVRITECDVTVKEQLQSTFAVAESPDGRLDIAVANAG